MLPALVLAIAVAQDTAHTAAPPLTLDAVVAAALESSPRISAAQALARASRAAVSQSRRPPDPQLQLGFMNYSLPGLAPMPTTGMTQLSLMQMVPTAGKLGAAGRGASARAEAAADRSLDVEWEVRASAAMLFYELYATDRSLEVARETLRLLNDARATAEAMYRVGSGRQADVLRAQVEIARMVEDTVRMTTMRVATAARLNALLDRAAESPVGQPVLPVFPDSVPARSTLIADAESTRPMVQAALREVDAASADADVARREIWPDLTVGVQYGQRGSAMGTERMGSLMLGASLPIFARDRQLQMREEAASMRRMADAELAEMKARTRADVSVSHATLQRARTLARLYRTTILPQAEAAANSSQAAYRVGQVDFMALLDDRMTVNRYRQELFVLESEEGRAWAELEMLLGRRLLGVTTMAGADGSAGGQ